MPFPVCNYCSISPSYHHGRCCPLEPSFKNDISVAPPDRDLQSFESTDEQLQVRTKAMDNVVVTQEVELAVSQKALNPLACVPKPRPPMPSDTHFQQAEVVKNMLAY